MVELSWWQHHAYNEHVTVWSACAALVQTHIMGRHGCVVARRRCDWSASSCVFRWRFVHAHLSQCELMQYVSCVGVHVPQYLSLEVI